MSGHGFSLDLTDVECFAKENNKLEIKKNINFIFGKNGTGKSTLTRLIKEQKSDEYDVRIFDGFEGVVRKDNKLNAVVLGEKNNEIDNKIKKYENDKKELEREIRKKESQINEPSKKEDNSYVYSNLWVKRHEKEKERKNQQGIKNKCFRDIAKKLKEDEPHIVKTSYNKQDVEKQVDNALNAEMLSSNKYQSLEKQSALKNKKQKIFLLIE